MSGKKKSEVADVLKDVEDAQDKTFESNIAEIDEAVKSLRELEKEYKSISSKGDLIAHFSGDGFEKEKNSISKNLQIQRKRVGKIRESIKNKYHYCNDEFKAAAAVQKEIERIKDQYSKLQKASSDKAGKAALKLAEIKKDLKRGVEDAICKFKERFESASEFKTLEDDMRENENKISLLSFLKKYKSDETEKRYKELLEETEKAKEIEKYKKAGTLLEKLEELFQDAHKTALSIREKYVSSAGLAFSIRDVMLNNGFDVNVIVKNESLEEGFIVECTIEGGDTIIFDKVILGENGPEIEMDHTESTSGTCSVKWKDLRKDFNDAGIPVTDVLKDGKSVIFVDQRSRTKTKPNEKAKAR